MNPISSDLPQNEKQFPDAATAPPGTAETLKRVWADPPGWRGWIAAVQNDTIGVRILATAFFFFILGGFDSLVIRTQLAVPENTFVDAELYNKFFTMHGSVIMYLVILPMLEGFTILALPFLLGSREMPFPRLGVFSYFTFLFGGLLFYSSALLEVVPDTGWTAYVPLSSERFSPGLPLDYWLLGLSVAEIGAIAAGVEIIIAILKMRAPGMTLSRMPLFAWAMLVTAFMLIFAFTTLLIGSLLLELDRKHGTQFFDPDAGGSPILWQHLFWIFGHPEVYIQFLPATGIVSMILPVFTRRPIIGYRYVAMAIVATGFLSFGLWAHHMFSTGLPPIVLTLFAVASMMIAIPSGVQVFAWLGTIWHGRPVWKTPFLFVVGAIVIFVLGGITGVMTASVPLDWQVHDSYFVVAHFHYVLIGGVVFPIFAGFYYWLPKFTGKLLSERLGRWNFWLMFIGFNIAFFPMHIVGLMGMPRRIYTYPAETGWGIYNLISTIGAFILFFGILLFAVNVVVSVWKGKPAGANPWGGDSLEWAVPSPPPNYGFAVAPIIHSRHPLWEQKNLHQGEPRLESLVHAIARWPLKWRAALVTGTLDGQPEELFRVSGPSFWPFFASGATILIFIGELFNLYWVIGLGVFGVVGSLILWHWPDKAGHRQEEEEEFERTHNISVNPKGSRAVSLLGMQLAVLIVGIALATFLFSYFYIRFENPVWPPEGIAPPQALLAVISTLLLLASGGGMIWAVRAIRQGNRGSMRLGLAIAFLLGALALGVQIFDFSRLGFRADFHAYGSLFYILSGFAFAVLSIGLVMNALAQFWAWRGEYTARDHVGIENTALFWYAVVVVWLLIFITLYGVPYLTQA
jgi:cytochrome c oxidase subunit I+III